jgi:hypothetical protein
MEPGVILADGGVEMDEDHEKEPEMEVDESDDEGGNVSGMDSDHEE